MIRRIKKVDDEIVVKIEEFEELGHEICMGIRHGLFGAMADKDASIDNTIMEALAEVRRWL